MIHTNEGKVDHWIGEYADEFVEFLWAKHRRLTNWPYKAMKLDR